jgi:hypothetical protein
MSRFPSVPALFMAAEANASAYSASLLAFVSAASEAATKLGSFVWCGRALRFQQVHKFADLAFLKRGFEVRRTIMSWADGDFLFSFWACERRFQQCKASHQQIESILRSDRVELLAYAKLFNGRDADADSHRTCHGRISSGPFSKRQFEEWR